MPQFLHYCACVLAAMLLGATIGLERQWRRSATGLRTNTLVAVGSALFVLIGPLTGVKDTRIAAQIVSGIGFIGGGAILREGLTIRGVNTAATLWCSAAMGALCGSGLLREAAVAGAVILFANLILRPITYKLSTGTELRTDVQTSYLIRLTCQEIDESRLRRILVSAVDSASLMIRSIHSSSTDSPGMLSIVSVVISPAKQDQLVERIVGTLSADPSVTAISWEIVTQPNDGE
jgi:putative Mg2+ transporter-C (MgtC) family protein